MLNLVVVGERQLTLMNGMGKPSEVGYRAFSIPRSSGMRLP